jgi:protein involved in polysaccharide export with SLBB domain
MTSQTLPGSTFPGAPRGALVLSRAFAMAAMTAILAFGAPAAAQQPAGAQPLAQRADTTLRSALRVELESRAASLEAAGKREEAADVRRRLAEGDFPVGDRVVVDVTGSLVFRDTLAVRTGQVLTIANLPDISLRGVLRPELTDYLTRQIGHFVRDPVVHAQSLVRVSVSGTVARPGFYSMPADILLGDAIMRAGGPTPDTDMGRTVVKRGKSETLDKGAVQRAIRDGATLEQVGVRAGDEIVVGKKRNINLAQVVIVSASVLGSIVAIASLLNR